MRKKAKHVIVLLVMGLLLPYGCRTTVEHRPESSAETSESLPGLEIKGSRTRANVVANLLPALREMHEIYEKHLARNPDLKGRLDLRFTVEWTGEVIEIEILRSTISDEVFKKAVLHTIQFLDFDGWVRTEEDTEIVYPIEFGE